MNATRARVALAAAGLSGLLALGAAVPASAGTAPVSSTTRTAVRAPAAAHPVPFPGKSPAAIAALSMRTMKAASSVHLLAHTKEASSTLDVDFLLGSTAARGTITSSELGALSLIRVRSRVWISGDAKFWKHTGVRGASVLAGKWLAVTGKDAQSAKLRKALTVGFWANTFSDFTATRRVPTVGLLGGDTTLYVAAKGRPFPLLMVHNTNPSDTVALFDWNKRVIVKAPKTSRVINAPGLAVGVPGI